MLKVTLVDKDEQSSSSAARPTRFHNLTLGMIISPQNPKTSTPVLLLPHNNFLELHVSSPSHITHRGATALLLTTACNHHRWQQHHPLPSPPRVCWSDRVFSAAEDSLFEPFGTITQCYTATPVERTSAALPLGKALFPSGGSPHSISPFLGGNRSFVPHFAWYSLVEIKLSATAVGPSCCPILVRFREEHDDSIS
jgi:hypothetical protein